MNLKENEPDFASITIPHINEDIPFSGTIMFQNDKPKLWIGYSCNDEKCRKLFSLVEDREFFTCYITYHDCSHLSMYQCFSLTGLIAHTVQTEAEIKNYKAPGYNTGYLEIACNSWFEDYNIDNNSQHFKSFSISFPSLAPYLRGTNNNELHLSENISIVFLHGKRETLSTFPYSKSETETCLIYCKNINGKFSLANTHEIILSIQSLIRYLTDIPFPLGEIKFFSEDQNDIGAVYHPNCGIDGTLLEINCLQYLKPTFPFAQFAATPESLIRWNDAWDKSGYAIMMYVDCQNLSIPLNKKLLLLTKSFDKLSSMHFPLKITEDKVSFSQWVKSVCDEADKIQKSFEFKRNKLQDLLYNANRCAPLKQRIIKYAETKEDILNVFLNNRSDLSRIIKYIADVRNSESHASNFDIISNVPEGYKLHSIVKLMNELVKLFINEFILKIQDDK